MKKTILIFVLISLLVSGCTERSRAVVVGKDLANMSVDIRLDNGDVKSISLSDEQYYSGDFEVGAEWYVSCVVERCSVLEKASANE